jgi:hypothetical protein
MMRNLAAVAVLVAGLLLARHNGAVLVAALVIAYFLGKSGGSSPALAGGRYVAGHAHGERKLISRHEAGHAVVARAVGGRVRSATMTDNDGLVRARIPDDPVKVVAFLAAGRYAAGTGRGCSADYAAIRKELRGVPSKHRGQVKCDGLRLARRTVAARSGEIRRSAARLSQHGRL